MLKIRHFIAPRVDEQSLLNRQNVGDVQTGDGAAPVQMPSGDYIAETLRFLILLDSDNSEIRQVRDEAPREVTFPTT